MNFFVAIKKNHFFKNKKARLRQCSLQIMRNIVKEFSLFDAYLYYSKPKLL